MTKQRPKLMSPEDRGPLRVMFASTSLPIGGAETLLVNLVRKMDRERFAPEICCLKELGPLGEELSGEIPAHSELLSSKYDLRVFGRLKSLLRKQRIDALVTIGAGDKMFWGRLAAWWVGTPVVMSALHSTGWPDGVGRLNRLLTPITDAFIGVAEAHGRHLIERERFPEDKVHVIPNGVDMQRFSPRPKTRSAVRADLGISPQTPVCGIVAALRPEKNHQLFLQVASMVKEQLNSAQFLIIGDGPERGLLERTAAELGINKSVHFLGSRSDIPELLTAMDLFALTSHNEANPVSILEAMATGLPVVSTRVGSISESVRTGANGFLATPGDADELAAHWMTLLGNRNLAEKMGQLGRQIAVDYWSLERMVEGYQNLILKIYNNKCSGGVGSHSGEKPTIPEKSLNAK